MFTKSTSPNFKVLFLNTGAAISLSKLDSLPLWLVERIDKVGLVTVKFRARYIGTTILVLISVLSFVYRGVVWSRCVQFLIAPDSPAKSDVIFLLGGDYMLRAPYAAQLYKEGYASKIIIAREPVHRKPENVVDFSRDTIRTLEACGVPRTAIVDFTPSGGVTSTADEARALRIYADVYPINSVLVVTSMLHTRRARIAIKRALRGKGIRVLVVCVGKWRDLPNQQAQAREEMIKLIYYFVTFWG
jgi:uncharacterized SAM-binding protein YcdF (DUF218 family)